MNDLDKINNVLHMFKEKMEAKMALALEKPVKNKPLTKPKAIDSGFMI